MDKRYQVFVSSTFLDLEKERGRVLQTLMEMDCIPAGMELFPAADEEQLEFIKKVIDDCDYYIVIVGGRYGTPTVDGISFTEKEYDYAVSLKVIALLHEHPEELPAKNSEWDPETMRKLRAFRDKLAKGRLVKTWNRGDELPGLVALSLQKTIKSFPAVGWIRASHEPREELLEQINRLMKGNERLELELHDLKAKTTPVIPDIAGLDESYAMEGVNQEGLIFDQDGRRNIERTWREIFQTISPYISEGAYETEVQNRLSESLFGASHFGSGHSIVDQAFQTVKVQFLALNLIEVKPIEVGKGAFAPSWKLTQQGRQLMFESTVVRSSNKTPGTLPA
jgi:hypothetical protein